MAASATAAATTTAAVGSAQITVPELVENLGNFYARFARHKLEAGAVSLGEIAESFLAPDKHGVPRLGDLCKQLRTLYGAVPFLTRAQLRIAQAPASVVAAGKEGSYGLVSAKIRRFEANRRRSIRRSGGWARDIEVRASCVKKLPCVCSIDLVDVEATLNRRTTERPGASFLRLRRFVSIYYICRWKWLGRVDQLLKGAGSANATLAAFRGNTSIVLCRTSASWPGLRVDWSCGLPTALIPSSLLVVCPVNCLPTWLQGI